jgi:hypothetical protein
MLSLQAPPQLQQVCSRVAEEVQEEEILEGSLPGLPMLEWCLLALALGPRSQQL